MKLHNCGAQQTAPSSIKTVRLRRSRPSGLSLALALMLTMLFVYAVALSAPERAQKASAQPHMQQEIHLEGLTARFLVYARVQDGYAARIEAANCFENGGAGWIINEKDHHAVIFDMAQASDEDENAGNIIERTAGGLTLEISGGANVTAAVADGAQFLRSMAAETASLASMLESGGDVSGVRALLAVYKTRADKICAALAGEDHPAAVLIRDAAQRTSARIDAAFSDMRAAKIRLIHTAANAEWLSLIKALEEI